MNMTYISEYKEKEIPEKKTRSLELMTEHHRFECQVHINRICL